ncbi:hypothetical protein [Mycobacterium basiliense]
MRASHLEHDGAPDVWEQQVTDLARSVTAWTGSDCRVVEFPEDDVPNAGR